MGQAQSDLARWVADAVRWQIRTVSAVQLRRHQPVSDRPRLEITTSNGDPYLVGGELQQARSTLINWLQNAATGSPWPDASHAALTLWLAARHREVRAKVLDATQGEQLITIDGIPEPFLMLTAPTGRWVAIRRHYRLTITVAAHDVDPATITLEPMPDPAACVLGPKPDDP